MHGGAYPKRKIEVESPIGMRLAKFVYIKTILQSLQSPSESSKEKVQNHLIHASNPLWDNKRNRPRKTLDGFDELVIPFNALHVINLILAVFC